MSPKGRSGRRKPREGEWIRSFHEALCTVEDHILPLSDDEFLGSDLHQKAAIGALGQIRAAAQHITTKTLSQMPEVVANDIAEIRNVTTYDYPLDNAHLILTLLRNGTDSWRAGIDRARGQARDGQPLTPRPTRSDGSLQRSRPKPICAQPVKSADDAPCILSRGHGGHCRSRI